MLAAGSEVVIENLVFLNGKFNTCWKVWVLMLAAGSEVLMNNYLPAELWSTPLSSTSGVQPVRTVGKMWPDVAIEV